MAPEEFAKAVSDLGKEHGFGVVSLKFHSRTGMSGAALMYHEVSTPPDTAPDRHAIKNVMLDMRRRGEI